MKLLRFSALIGITCLLSAQELDPKKLLSPPTDTWPTFHGDYSGRRHSPLKQINSENIQNLGLAWVYRVGGGGSNAAFGTSIKATPLQVSGVLYCALPDYAYAVDARNGREIWSYKWESQGGIHIGNRRSISVERSGSQAAIDSLRSTEGVALVVVDNAGRQLCCAGAAVQLRKEIISTGRNNRA